jgi:hypothetical protein
MKVKEDGRGTVDVWGPNVHFKVVYQVYIYIYIYIYAKPVVIQLLNSYFKKYDKFEKQVQ